MKSKPVIVFVLYALFYVQAQAQELLNYPVDTINDEEVYRYQVEKSIGLYRIGVNFNVPQSEIVRLNPQLRERGLHFGETLLIPTGRPVVKRVMESITPRPEKTDAFVKDTIIPDIPAPITIVPNSPAQDTTAQDTMSVAETRNVVELALMLPFESQQTKRSGNAERMMEFYQGSLLALRDMQNDSTLYRLRVYDTERSEHRVNALCDSTELNNVQGILGLVYPIQIERVAAWCEQHQVPLLLPFCDDMDLEHHPHVLQFNSSDEQEADSLCAWIAQQGSIHCITIEVREADIASSIRTLHKQMKKHGISYTGMPLRDLMNDSVAYAVDSTKENLIILHSDRYQNVRMLLPHISKLQQAGYAIRIVSQYSWQKEQISLPQVYTSMFTIEGERNAYDAVWSESFKNSHVSDSPRYDLLGYDLMRSLVGWLRGERESNGLQSAIRWIQTDNGGYQNAQVHVVVK